MTGLLTITQHDHPAARVIVLRGPLDAHTTPQLDQVCNDLIAMPEPPALTVFDCSEVNIMGSLAMGSFIRLKRELLRKNASMRLSTLHPSVFAALRHARLHLFFEIYDTVEAAVGEIHA
ncbi:MAG: STAS domain-containing protein [Phycisphaeraceae bacterium]|nr:STAS domain-containing protein [Phycisphaeraceae bacterium]